MKITRQFALRIRLWRADNCKRFRKHPLETRVSVQIHRRHETCERELSASNSDHEIREVHDWEGCVWIWETLMRTLDACTICQYTYPTECNQTSFLREFQNQLLFVHCARITGRMLLGDQQRCHHKLLFLILPE
jgi:hypothetical protein